MAVPDTVGVVVAVPLLAGVVMPTVGIPKMFIDVVYVLLAALSVGAPVTVPLIGN